MEGNLETQAVSFYWENCADSLRGVMKYVEHIQIIYAVLCFALQIFLLIVFMCITLLIASLICLTLPGMS